MSSESNFSNPASAFITSQGPSSSTTQMASQVPLEKDKEDSDHVPGAFPAETPQGERKENPIPDSGDNSNQTFGVSPLPATAGIGNPVSTKPGESLPSTENYAPGKSIQSHVKTDKESYEKSDAYPSSENKPVETQGGAFGVPPVTSGMIPESSLPMGNQSGSTEKDAGPFMQSTGAGSSTAAMAGQVPKEPRGQAEVVGSDEEQTKAQSQDKGTEGGNYKTMATTAMGGAAAAAAGASKSIQNAFSGSSEKQESQPAPGQTAAGVPEKVSESQAEADIAPEASANPSSVAHKGKMESELQDKITPAQEDAANIADENTLPSISAANSGGLEKSSGEASSTQNTAAGASSLNAPASDPAKTSVTESIEREETATDDAKPPTESASKEKEKSGAFAPAKDKAAVGADSRDISPMTRPSVTTGTSKGHVPKDSVGTTSSAASNPNKDDKKKNRRSLFGKIKDKLKN
ncbi:MAG: hypothetical protein M1831_004958 [Alyxoria varia]|nr:MAG: hypothetical protein M1831_004958 [Alyxoria varia]